MAVSVRKWLMHKFKDINKDRMKRHIDIIQKNSGKSKMYIRFDIVKSFFLYGAGYTDYFRGDFIHLNREEKKTWATARRFYRLNAYLNDERYSVILQDKLIFNEMFREYLKRDFISLRKSTPEDLRRFLKGKDIVFAKANTGEGGHGIKKLIVSEIKDVDELYRDLCRKGQYLIEEAIIQSDELNEINPYVVNSFRVVTIHKGAGEGAGAKVVSNALRINQDASEVIGCTNDLYFSLAEDGHISSNVIDDYANVYETHPMTGKRFSEVCIHDVKKAFEMCEEAAERIPQVRYIGWDVAFSVNGPVLVEGNEYPGYGILQFYALNGSRTGHLKEVADFLGDEYKNIRL